MADLSERQKQLLKAIIDEYISTAQPVGSDSIVEKHSLGVSPATVRNEMVTLTKNGYLSQPHTSAGRSPTPMGLKFYINELMKEQNVPVKDEVEIKANLWDHRFHFHRLLKQATKELAEKTGTLAIANTEEGDVFHSGGYSILDMPEFVDIDLTKTLLMLADRQEMLNEILDRAVINEPVVTLLGDELGSEYLEYCGFVLAPFGAGKKHAGVIGILGPNRMDYPQVIPKVRYFGDLLSELVSTW
jgi:heat-inducible transcriptional repressor